MQDKSRKKLVLAGAARFNSKPKSGIAFLEENKLIYSDLSPDISRARSLAIFLKSCTRLDKRLLGDYISKPDNLELLKEFLGLFDFKNVCRNSFLMLTALTVLWCVETNCRCYARNAGDLPTSWRISANSSDYRDFCFDLLCVWARYSPTLKNMFILFIEAQRKSRQKMRFTCWRTP
jgi:hypothetical protein